MQALQVPYLVCEMMQSTNLRSPRLLRSLVAYSCICRVQEPPPRINLMLAPQLEPVWRVLILLLPRDKKGNQCGPKKKEYRFAVRRRLAPYQPLATLLTVALFYTGVPYRCIFGL